MTVRAVIIPRARDRVRICGFQRPEYRCCMEANRLIESWHPSLGKWLPELFLCHLHAITYLTGEHVTVPTIAQQERILRDLGA